MGPKHHYALLALISKEVGKEIEIVEDLRHTFQPLTNLRAIDISYENGDRLHSGAAATTTTVQAAIQRLSGGRLHVLPGHGNTSTIEDLAIEAGEIYELKPSKGKRGTFSSIIGFNDIYHHQPLLMYTIRSRNRSSSSPSSSDVRHEIHMLAQDEHDKWFKDPIEDGTRNYYWRGFEIEADVNVQISWSALGDSYTYFERFVKRALDDILRTLFGVDTDQLKQDKSVLDAWWHKNLEKVSESGGDLAQQAEQHWYTLQEEMDKWVRKSDKQLKTFQKDVEKALYFEDEEGEEKKKKGESKQLLMPSAQTVKCPSCGHPNPKEKKYAFCTKCGTELPIQ
jgi:hypothetical protein